MNFGVELVPYHKPKELKSLAEKIEAEKFDYLWVSDHYHNRFVHSILTYLSGVTENIKLGPGVTNPYLVHPAVTAAAAATLDELSEGRATLGISAGDPSFLESVGKKHDKPITAVREAIEIIRRLLKGGKVNFSGDMFNCNEAKLGFSPLGQIPIYVGGRREQMMKLAGSLANGALFNASHPKDIDECMEFVREGAREADRDLEDFDHVAYIATSIGKSREKAREKAKSVTSFVAASAPESTLDREDISKQEVKGIQNNLMAGNPKKARNRVSEKMIDVFSVSGTIDKLEERIEKFRKMGVTQVVIGSPLGPDAELAIEEIGKLIESYS